MADKDKAGLSHRAKRAINSQRHYLDSVWEDPNNPNESDAYEASKRISLITSSFSGSMALHIDRVLTTEIGGELRPIVVLKCDPNLLSSGSLKDKAGHLKKIKAYGGLNWALGGMGSLASPKSLYNSILRKWGFSAFQLLGMRQELWAVEYYPFLEKLRQNVSAEQSAFYMSYAHEQIAGLVNLTLKTTKLGRRQTIGDAYENLGVYDDGEKLLVSVFHLRRYGINAGLIHQSGDMYMSYFHFDQLVSEYIDVNGGNPEPVSMEHEMDDENSKPIAFWDFSFLRERFPNIQVQHGGNLMELPDGNYGLVLPGSRIPKEQHEEDVRLLEEEEAEEEI